MFHSIKSRTNLISGDLETTTANNVPPFDFKLDQDILNTKWTSSAAAGMNKIENLADNVFGTIVAFVK